MKILKHKKKDVYLFTRANGLYVESILIDTKKNLLDNDFHESEKFDKFLKKQNKKGFIEIEGGEAVARKVEQYLKKVEMDKLDYFILKKDKKQKSLICKVGVIHDGDLYRVVSFEEDNESFPLFEMYQAGFIALSKRKYLSHEVIPALRYYLTILYTLGFEMVEETDLITYATGKPFEYSKEHAKEIYKIKNPVKYDAEYVEYIPHIKNRTVEYNVFGITDGKIVFKHISINTFSKANELIEGLKKIKEVYANTKVFEKPISTIVFFEKYKLALEKTEDKKYFEPPEKEAVSAPLLALHVPSVVIPIKEFQQHLIELNALYFYANTSENDPLDWQVAFICAKELKENNFITSDIFALKDFNQVYRKVELSDIDDRDDLEQYIKKASRKFKKNGLKAIDTKTILEALSGQSIEIMQQQEPLALFVETQDQVVELLEVFENYANIYTPFKEHFLQFFRNIKERESWLKSYQLGKAVLYDNQIESITKFVAGVKLSQDNYLIKQQFVTNPKLEGEFSRPYPLSKLNQATFEQQKKWYIRTEYTMTVDKSLYIDGNLTVDGALYIKPSEGFSTTNKYLYIKGNLKAKHLIIEGGFEFIFVEGSVIVEHVTVIKYARQVVFGKESKTKILLHTREFKNAIDNSLSYENEVSIYSEVIIDKSIIKKGDYGDSFNFAKIYELLTHNIDANDDPTKVDMLRLMSSFHPTFLAKELTESKEFDDKYYKRQFENRMLSWGDFYPEYAGCESLGICEDNEIKGNCIYPGSGDWVVNDLRGQSGTYGVSHDDYSICKLRVKNPKKYNINYKQKPIKLAVGVEELMNRYIAISMLYMNWAHRDTVAFTTEEKRKEFYEKYDTEKATFVEDPHLALYWLNHFGATLDRRYSEVVKIIEDNDLVEKLPILNEPLAFFKLTDGFYNLNIKGGGDKKKFVDLFLKRRSYLIYFEQVYKNYDIEHLDLWWKSISIYPKVDTQLIVRMRWLKNNLKKCNAWNLFEDLTADEPKDIPLLSYIFVCNPNTSAKEKAKYADIFVTELYTHRNEWKAPHKRSFGEIMLWDVRTFVKDKALLEKAANFYFESNELSKEYVDIQKVLGVENGNLEEVKESVDKLKKAFVGFDRFDTSKKDKVKYHNKIDSILEKMEPDILLESVSNVTNIELAKRCFVYLWNSDIQHKQETLIRLFIRIEFSGHDINKEIFGSNFTKLLKNEEDPNLEIAKAFLKIPEDDFRNDSMWENSKEAAVKFFLNVAHLPKVFEFLIKTIQQKPTKENVKVLDAIYTKLFSTEYDSKINPTLKFSKKQMEIMLKTICDWFLRYGYHAEGYRSIYYCTNPLAEEWVRERYNNKKWLKQFAHINTFYDPLDEEVNEALESALEFMEIEKHNAYLEYEDEKSHKFWKIAHYGEGYTVTYGKVGTEGQSKTKDFDSEQQAFKAGDKLVASKLNKGYKKITV